MTAFYNPDPAATEAESLAAIAKLVEMCAPHPAFIDTAYIYAHPASGAHNETLVGKAIAIHGRDKFILATKFGIDPSNFASDSSKLLFEKQLDAQYYLYGPVPLGAHAALQLRASG
jgi:aryl-alcohol dehydrogenase-like predicted oxidoreductase